MKSAATRSVPVIPVALLFLAAMLFLGACSTPGQTAQNNGAAGTQSTEGSEDAMGAQNGTDMIGKESGAENSAGNSTAHPAELIVNTPAEEINGLSETEEDRIRAEKGNISLQLRNPEIDNTHLNEYGYTALAYGVYDTGKALGYW